MKIKYMAVYITLLVVIVLGCVTGKDSNDGGVVKSARSYAVIMVDGHEYLVPDRGGITHSASCGGLH